jgi:hypothetical protein
MSALGAPSAPQQQPPTDEQDDYGEDDGRLLPVAVRPALELEPALSGFSQHEAGPEDGDRGHDLSHSHG